MALLLLLVGCEYHAPTVKPVDHQSGEVEVAPPNVISGDIVLGLPLDVPGHVVVFAADVANPMPPMGTGRPVQATTVPASAFDLTADGTFSAPFSMSLVPDGTYYLTAFMDLDDNFNPLLIDALGGATCGDIGGAHLTDLVSQQFAAVTVSGGAWAEKVTIVLAQPFGLERPAFVLNGDNVIDLDAAAGSPTSQKYTVDSTGIESTIYDIAGPDEFNTPACGTIFPVYGPDADGDGLFDPHPVEAFAAQGVRNVWPKVFVQYLGEPVTHDDGSITYEWDHAPGEGWASENVPDPAYTLLGQIPVNQVTFMDELRYVFPPAAAHITADGPVGGVIVTDVSLIPRGAWSMTMISFTGQTWTVPNEIRFYPALDGSGFDPASQSSILVTE